MFTSPPRPTSTTPTQDRPRTTLDPDAEESHTLLTTQPQIERPMTPTIPTMTPTISLDAPTPNQHSLPLPIHGIIPGTRPSSFSISNPALPLSISTPPPPSSAPSPSLTLLPRRSSYPLASPPGFLYPSPIVPVAAHAAAQAYQDRNWYRGQARDRGAPRGVPGAMEHGSASLPAGLKVVLGLTVLTMSIAVLWSVLVWAVNFPAARWDGVPQREAHRKSTRGKNRGDKMTAEQKEHAEGDELHTYAVTTGLSPRLDPQFSIGSSASTANPTSVTSSMRARCSTSIPTSPSHARLTSPANPYLTPLPTPSHTSSARLTHRTSSEWLTARAAYFSTADQPSPPPCTQGATSRCPSHACSSTSTSNPSTRSTANAADISAMEAGTAPLTAFAGRVSGFATCGTSDGDESGLLRWIEDGLDLVDGAVDRVVGRVVRWGDDGGEGELLLPVVEGRV